MKIKGEGLTGNTSIEYEVSINGENCIVCEDIELTNEEQELVINLTEPSKPSRKLGEYQGNTATDTNTNIFANSAVNDTDTNNYIKISFANKNNVKFIITFEGYYNKAK